MRINRHIRQSYYISIAASISTVILLGVSFFVINPASNKTEEAFATTGTATPATTSLTLNSANNSSSVIVTANSAQGTFVSSNADGTANFSIATDNYTGYTLSIVAGDDTGNLEDYTHTYNINSISSNLTEAEFSNANNTAYNNKWGYKPSKYIDTTNNTVVDNTGDSALFLPAPTTTATLLDKTTTANNTANEYSIALGIRADTLLPSGTYIKTLNLVATANPISYSVTYNKNTEDAVTGMPETQASETSATSITLHDDVPVREHYSFLGWCNVEPTNTNGTDSCTGTNPTTGATATIYNPNGDGTNLTYGIDHTVSNTNVTLYAMWQIDTFTCTKQYRLQNADGTWGNYIADGTETINYGGSCAYAKTVTDYKNSASGTNGAQASTTATNVTGDVTVSLDFYRNTYTLTVTAGTNTSSATGGGTKRWGEAATVGVTKASNVTCTAYGTPTWTQSGTAGTFSATSGASVTFTMGKGNATVTATSVASNVAQTITLSRGTGVASIKIGSTNYTAASVSLNCGTYNISGNYNTNYEFSSWGRANGVAVANTAAASTTMTVTGAGTLTLTGKQSCTTISGYLQDFTGTGNYCSTTGTLTDSRDGTSYAVGKLADGKWWLLDNLALDLTNASVKASLTSSTTNASDATLNYLKNGGGTTSDQYATAGVANWTSLYSFSAPLINTASKSTQVSYAMGQSGTGKVGVYYNYCAATAGSYCYGDGTNEEGTPSGDATEDICPKGWRMPTGGSSGEYQSLYDAYSSDGVAFVNALHTPLSGSFFDDAVYYQGSRGLFWSSTKFGDPYNNISMHRLYVETSYVYPPDLNDRIAGHSVRCVLQ